MFQAGTDRALDDQIQRPKPFEPDPKKFSLGETVGAAFRGISAGSTEQGAFAAEVLGTFGDTLASTAAFGGGGMFRGLSEQERKDAEAARKKLDQAGTAFNNPAGDLLRQRAAEIMPDPQTTHAASQVVAGLTRFGTKAIGSVAAGGPVGGPLLLGADEALTEADKLQRQGVDLSTRAKAGAVAGGSAALAVALPVAAPGSIAKTVGLVAAGGPGTFMAQNAAERAILANAGYEKLAEQYDPFDPVGLALSTIVPAGFGAVALRGARVARNPATLHDVVMGLESRGQRYGKDGNLLTSPKGAKGEMQVMDATNLDPGFGVRPAADSGPAERARVGRDYIDAMVKRYGREDQAMAAYNAGPGAVDAAIKKGGNWLDHLPAETQKYVADGMRKLGGERVNVAARRAVESDPDVVAAARTNQIIDQLDRSRLTPATDLPGMDAHQRAIETAHAQLANGEPVGVSDLVTPDPVRLAEVQRAIDQGLTDLQRGVTDSVLESVGRVREFLEGPARNVQDNRSTVNLSPISERTAAIIQRDTGLEIPPGAFQELSAPTVRHAQRKHPNLTAGDWDSLAWLSENFQQAVRLKTGKADQGPRMALVARDPATGMAYVGEYRVGKGKGGPRISAVTFFKDHPNTVDSYLRTNRAEREGYPRRADAEPPALTPKTVRGDGEIVGQEAAAPESGVSAQIEAENPGLYVRQTEEGRLTTAKEELEAVRREALEGTDQDIGVNDADLIQVAANCFLRS